MPAEFDKLRLAIKSQLKKDNPGLNDNELESRSFAIATAQWKKTHNGKGPSENINSEKLDVEEKFDEQGRIIVAENFKFHIDGGISSIEE
ncbi:hypothetical protein KAI04_04805 [Candidatus Pacearchaeota archaeon]|nr:hypothetical protein [Candidatus Pacearchaeota archaeon]